MSEVLKTTPETLDRLVEQICSSFPEAHGTLFLNHKGGKVNSLRGLLIELMPVMKSYCLQFPLGVLRFEPEHQYGMVCTLWCHCTANTGCEEKCRSDAERPRAMIVIERTNSGEVEIGSQESPSDQFKEALRVYEETKLPRPS